MTQGTIMLAVGLLGLVCTVAWLIKDLSSARERKEGRVSALTKVAHSPKTTATSAPAPSTVLLPPEPAAPTEVLPPVSTQRPGP